MENKFYIKPSLGVEVDAYSTLGLIPEKDVFYPELLKLPEANYKLTKNWADQHGTQRAFQRVEYNNRELELKWHLYGTSKEDLFAKYNAIKQITYGNKVFDLKCVDMDRLFTLKYSSMPAFEKLTIFNGDGKKYIKLSINVIDEYPTVFKDAAGVLIPLVFPSPNVDGFNVSENDFEIVDDLVIMTLHDVVSNHYKLDGNEIFNTYGLIPDKGMHNALMKFADAKISGKLETRSLELPFYLNATSEVQFYYKYYALTGFLLNGGYFNLDVTDLNRRFTLCYSAMTAFEKLTLIKGNDKIYAGLKIIFFDDFPTSEQTPDIYDGLLTVDNEGNLIFSQGDQYDDKIDFEIDEEGDFLVTTTD